MVQRSIFETLASIISMAAFRLLRNGFLRGLSAVSSHHQTQTQRAFFPASGHRHLRTNMPTGPTGGFHRMIRRYQILANRGRYMPRTLCSKSFTHLPSLNHTSTKVKSRPTSIDSFLFLSFALDLSLPPTRHRPWTPLRSTFWPARFFEALLTIHHSPQHLPHCQWPFVDSSGAHHQFKFGVLPF